MTRKDVLPEGAQVEWEETTWTRWTRDGKTAWWGTHYGVYAQIGGTAARIMDEVYHLRAKLQAARERVHGLPIDCYGDANAEGTDVLLARRDCVLAALGWDDE